MNPQPTVPIDVFNDIDASIFKLPKGGIKLNTPASLFTDKIKAIMDVTAPDSYRFVVCDSQFVLGSGQGGFARSAVDAPQLAATINDRLNIASMSKTLTAAAVLSTLQARNLSVDTPVAQFLPADWTLHPTVKTLTFRDFLTHRTGFNEATDRSDFAGIRQSLQQGPPNPAKAGYDYRNINFAVFRVILPLLNSYNRFTKKNTFITFSNVDPALTYAEAYISIVNARVLAPSGIAPAACDSKTLSAPTDSTNGRPGPKVPVLLYEYQNPGVKGLDLGERKLICGAEGWSLSVVDYAKFLQTLLFTEIIISEKNRALMLLGSPLANNGLGINMDSPIAGGNVYSHGAWIPWGKAQVAGWYLYFEKPGIVVVALSNAGHNPNQPNWFDSVKAAYTQIFS